jgi:hypothetical protein
VLNGAVRIASSTNPGIQNAVYTISGGNITSNVNLSLPALNNDDTIATLSANNVWTGQHTFTQGLTATGPITTTASITTPSSIQGGSLASTTGVTAAGDIATTTQVSAGTNINSGGNITLTGSINPGGTTNMTNGSMTSLSVANTSSLTGTVTAGGDVTVGGNHTVANTFNSSLFSGIYAVQHLAGTGTYHRGQAVLHFSRNLAYSGGTNAHLILVNINGGSTENTASDTDIYGLATGDVHGMMICTNSNLQKLGFHNAGIAGATIAQPSHGAIGAGGGTAGPTYTTNAFNMINDAYTCLRTKGLMV